MAKKAQAAQTFLSFASWAENKGYNEIANYFFRHSDDERKYMIKILDYILKRGAEVHLASVPAPPPNPLSLKECFDKVFEDEMESTKGIYLILQMCNEENDLDTLNYLQWLVKERLEDDSLTINSLAKYNLSDVELASEISLGSLNENHYKVTDDEFRYKRYIW